MTAPKSPRAHSGCAGTVRRGGCRELAPGASRGWRRPSRPCCSAFRHNPSLLLGLHPSTASARRRRGWRASCDASSSWQPPLTGALLPLIPSHLLLAFPLSRSLESRSSRSEGAQLLSTFHFQLSRTKGENLNIKKSGISQRRPYNQGMQNLSNPINYNIFVYLFLYK